jgi:PEP-CTERM motif
MSKQRSLTKWSGRIIAVLALLASAAGQAQADLTGIVYENTSSAGNATVANVPGSSTASANFSVGAIDYQSPPSGTTVADFLNNPTFSNLKNGFDPNGNVTSGNTTFGTYVLITGTLTLSAGSHTFTIMHDDGTQLTLSGQSSPVISSPGPTTETTNSQTLTLAAGTYTFNLAYGEVNGLPADLIFKVDGNIVGVPEPSTMAIAGLGAIGFTAYGLRRRKARTA